MDKDFRNSILKLREIDRKLAELFEMHEQYESEIQSIERRKFRTSAEEEKIKLLKFRKARGKEKMFEIISNHEKSPFSPYPKPADSNYEKAA
jgi:uncharacterized protein YdcH (DUF465 family)